MFGYSWSLLQGKGGAPRLSRCTSWEALEIVQDCPSAEHSSWWIFIPRACILSWISAWIFSVDFEGAFPMCIWTVSSRWCLENWQGGSPDRVLKTRFTPSESSAGHGLPPQRAPKQCPAKGVRRVLWGFVSRHGLLDMVKKHMAFRSFRKSTEKSTAKFTTKSLQHSRMWWKMASQSPLCKKRCPKFSSP